MTDLPPSGSPQGEGLQSESDRRREPPAAWDEPGLLGLKVDNSVAVVSIVLEILRTL